MRARIEERLIEFAKQNSVVSVEKWDEEEAVLLLIEHQQAILEVWVQHNMIKLVLSKSKSVKKL